MIIPKRIYDLALPHRAVAVYCYLCDRSQKTDSCFPSVRRIASDLNLNDRTVYRALRDLEDAGMIVREKRTRVSGARSSNLYKIRR